VVWAVVEVESAARHSSSMVGHELQLRTWRRHNQDDACPVLYDFSRPTPIAGVADGFLFSGDYERFSSISLHPLCNLETQSIM
jgi:hypothetical protein